ncbi:MAG: hypothetical protein R2939_13110 [Kofleriaceae bacterium]
MTTPEQPSEWPELLALLPRRPGDRTSRAEAHALLEAERTGVVALTVRAIAEAWDAGRLAGPGAALPQEREVLGLLGVGQGLAPERVREAREALATASAEARVLATELVGKLTPLDELIGEFALPPLARMVLVLVAAPHVWGEVAQLYAILANGASRPIVDEHLVRTLLGPKLSPLDLARTLDPDAPLRQFGLLREGVGGPRPFAPLAPHPLVLARLRGEPLDHDPAGLLAVGSSDRPLAELRLDPEVAASLRANLVRSGASPCRLVVRGRPGSGRRTLLAALAAHARRPLALVRLDHLHLADHERPTAGDLEQALRRCAIGGWIPCLDGLDAIDGEDRVLRDKLQHVLAAFPGPVLVRAGADEQLPLAPGYLQVDLPDLSETERAAVWQQALTRAASPPTTWPRSRRAGGSAPAPSTRSPPRSPPAPPSARRSMPLRSGRR